MLKIILGVIFIYPLINLVIGKVNKKTENFSNKLFLSPMYKDLFHILSSALGIIGFVLVFIWGFNKVLFHCIFWLSVFVLLNLLQECLKDIMLKF